MELEIMKIIRTIYQWTIFEVDMKLHRFESPKGIVVGQECSNPIGIGW